MKFDCIFNEANVENQIILSLLFPEPEDCRKEIYHHAVNIAKAIKEYKAVYPDCEHCDDDCILKKPNYIYFRSGIDVSLEDLEDDLIASLLKVRFGENYKAYYGFCLLVTIFMVIREHLGLVKKFLEKELIIPKESTQILIFIQMLVWVSKSEVRASLDKDYDIKTFVQQYLSDEVLYEKIH